MAGRGRGRGGRFYGGLEREPPTLEPPELYPALRQKPSPLEMNEKEQYMVAKMGELCEFMNMSAFYSVDVLDAEQGNGSVERYSDKFMREIAQENSVQSHCNSIGKWNQWFPRELKKKKRVENKKRKVIAGVKDILSQIGELKENDNEDNDNDEQKEDDVFDSEQDEEDNDYIDSYFDNGEGNSDEDVRDTEATFG
eukprot:Pgem_evm1s9545